MKVLMCFVVSISGTITPGHTFSRIDRFSEKDIRGLQDKLLKQVRELQPGVLNVIITSITPLCEDEPMPGGDKDKVELVIESILNILEGGET
jgi:hypothetical protein